MPETEFSVLSKQERMWQESCLLPPFIITMLYYYDYCSPVGTLWITATNDYLTAILYDKPQKITEPFQYSMDCSMLKDVIIWLDDYFKGNKPKINNLRMKTEGSPFQLTVWSFLCDIPYGEIVTYGEIANRVQKKTGKQSLSAQAVGGAVGKNPISIVIPCHRVMGSKGNLTGYGGGIKNKLWLLQHEKVCTDQFFIPKTKEKKICY